MPASVDRVIDSRVAALSRERGDTVRIEEVSRMVKSILAAMEDGPRQDRFDLYHGVQALARYIQHAREEIAALRTDEISDQLVGKASDELDAIVKATEAATNDILDSAEELSEIMGGLPPELAARVGAITTKLFEACNFQDLTGQRVTKVVTVLREIERRVVALMDAFGGAGVKGKAPRKKAAPAAKHSRHEEHEKGLLNGPQLPDKAADQASIDALFED